MAKYNKTILKQILTMTEEGHTIVDICTATGISKETYFQWKNKKPDFSDQLVAAEERMWEIRRRSLKTSLDKLINGYEVDYTETTAIQQGTNQDGSPKYIVTEVVKKKKIFPPNQAIVIKMLEALEPERFTDKQIIDVEHSISNTNFSIKRRAALPEGTMTIQPAEPERMPEEQQTDEDHED